MISTCCVEGVRLSCIVIGGIRAKLGISIARFVESSARLAWTGGRPCWPNTSVRWRGEPRRSEMLASRSVPLSALQKLLPNYCKVKCDTASLDIVN